jgi:GAF domain-containing protein
VAQDLPLADELAAVFARMSGMLLSQETVDTAVGVVTALAAESMPATVGSGVTLVDSRGRKTSSGASSALVRAADDLQYELDEGPCLSAWRERAVFRIDDMATETRWPRWTAAAAQLGLQATLSAPLVAGDRSLGAMKVYGDGPHVYTGRHEHLLTMFAAQAAVLLANVQSLDAAKQLSEQLKDAVRSRDVIGMAKGVLMCREGVDEATAFAMLTATSQHENRKLRDVAEDVARSTRRLRR